MNLRRGFTLIELVLVLTITTAVLSMGISSFVSVEKQYLKKAAEDLRSDLRTMQRLSMAEGKSYTLRFLVNADTTTNQYEISYFDMGEKILKIVTLPKGVTLLDTNAREYKISYTRRGTISGGGCSVILRNENYNVALTLTPASGRVSIKEIRPTTDLFTIEELEEL